MIMKKLSILAAGHTMVAAHAMVSAAAEAATASIAHLPTFDIDWPLAEVKTRKAHPNRSAHTGVAAAKRAARKLRNKQRMKK